MNIEKRMAEINARKLEIRSLLEGNEDVKLDEVKTELETLEAESKQLTEKRSLASAINADKVEVRKIEESKGDEKMKIEEMSIEQVLEAPEYRSAYLKQLQNKPLSDVEMRALTTASNSSGAAVPTMTLNKIIDKIRQTSVLFPKVSVSFMKGNVSLVVANAKNAASFKTEGTDGTPADDTVSTVNLTGFELIKLVEISAAAEAMTIDAFEAYIASEIGRQMAIAIENVILNGTGSGQPTGVLLGITWVNDTNAKQYVTLDYDSIVDGISLLPTMYHQNACLCMNRKMLFQGIRKIKTASGKPLFANEDLTTVQNISVLGYPVVINDYLADDIMIFGDCSYYYMNFAKSPEIASDRSVSFKSGKVTYRGLAVVDGKPGLAEAFIKIYK